MSSSPPSPRPSPVQLALLRRAAVARAGTAWECAPAHVRVLASAYVRPLLDALQAMSVEADARHQAHQVETNADGRAL